MTVNWTYSDAQNPQHLEEHNGTVYIAAGDGDLHTIFDGSKSADVSDPANINEAAVDIQATADNFAALYSNGDIFIYGSDSTLTLQSSTSISGTVRGIQPESDTQALVAVDDRIERWDVANDTLLNSNQISGVQMMDVTKRNTSPNTIFVAADNGTVYEFSDTDLSYEVEQKHFTSNDTVTEILFDSEYDISGDNAKVLRYDYVDEVEDWVYDTWTGLNPNDIGDTAGHRLVAEGDNVTSIPDDWDGTTYGDLEKYTASGTVKAVTRNPEGTYGSPAIAVGGDVIALDDDEYMALPVSATQADGSATMLQAEVSYLGLSAAQTSSTASMNDISGLYETIDSTPVSASATMNSVPALDESIPTTQFTASATSNVGIVSAYLNTTQAGALADTNRGLIDASYSDAEQVSVAVTMNESPLNRDVSGLGDTYWKITQSGFDELVIDAVSIEGGWPDFVVGESTEVEIVFERKDHGFDYRRLREYGEFLSDSTHSTGLDYQQRPYYTERLHPDASFESTLWKLEPGPGIMNARGWWVVVTNIEDNVQYGGIGGTMTLSVFVVAPVEEAPRNVIRQRYEV